MLSLLLYHEKRISHLLGNPFLLRHCGVTMLLRGGGELFTSVPPLVVVYRMMVASRSGPTERIAMRVANFFSR